MPRRRIVVVLLLAVAVAAAAVGLTVILHDDGGGEHRRTVAASLAIDLGDRTAAAATVDVGTESFSPGSVGTQGVPGVPAGRPVRQARVGLTEDTGGVGFVHDRAGHLLAITPVWSVRGGEVGVVPASCRSSAFSMVLLTPGLGTPDPIAVALLWGLANRAPARGDLDRLAALLCVGLDRDPDHLRRPGAEEISVYTTLTARLAGEVNDLARQAPDLATSLATVPSRARPKPTALGGFGGGAAVIRPASVRLGSPAPAAAETHAAITTRAVSDTRKDCTVRAPARDSDPAMTLCEREGQVTITNSSPAWTFLYPARAAITGLPAAIVPGQSVSVPSLERIVGAIVADGLRKSAGAICRTALSWFGPCRNLAKPSESRVAALFDLVQAGEGTAPGANGYYAVRWGGSEGARQAFPTGAGPADLTRLAAYSKTLTFLTGAIFPMIALIIDHQISLDLPPDQLPLLVPLFNDLIGNAVELGVTNTPATAPDQLKAVVTVAATVVSDPSILGGILNALAPGLFKDLHGLAEKLAAYLASLEVPVAGWAVFLVRTVDKGSAAATVALSIANLFVAQTRASYASWPGILDGRGAGALPVTRLPATDPGCPSPPAETDPPPGAPGTPVCLWAISADLDGDRRQDRVVIWRIPEDPNNLLFAGDQADGAVAYLDDGSTHVLDVPPQSGEPGSFLLPADVADVNGDGRQELVLKSGQGANTATYQLVTLVGDSLRIAHPAESLDSFTAGGGAGYGSDYGCVLASGHRLLVTVGYVTNWDDGGPDRPSTSWSRDLFQLDGAVLRTLGGTSGYQSAPRDESFLRRLDGNECHGTLRDLGPVPAPAATAKAAVTGLLTALARGDENSGRYYVSQAYSTGPDVWTAAKRLPDPERLARGSLTCESVSADAQACVVRASATSLPAATFELRVPRREHRWGVVRIAVAPSTDVTAAIIAAVRQETGATPGLTIDQIQVASTDPTWAYASISTAAAGTADVLLRRTGGTWRVVGLGTAEVGCGDGPPPATMSEFGLTCPG